MKRDIIMVSCRDEEDIIGVFIQYYIAAGFDAVHVIDNGSADGSVRQVEALATAGLPVSLEVDPRDGYERHLSQWFRAAGERYQPRWLFFLDCDEFILFPTHAKKYLDALPLEVNRLRLRQKETYPAATSDPRPGAFLLSRRSEPHFNNTTKDFVQWHPSAVVFGGKHRIEVPHAVTREPCDLYIRHYKYRSREQARRKEENRVAIARLYSDEELTTITAFGLQTSRAWIRHCEEGLKNHRWSESFSPDFPASDDPAMASYAAEFLPRLIVPDRQAP
jgi:hypothetical protein